MSPYPEEERRKRGRHEKRRRRDGTPSSSSLTSNSSKNSSSRRRDRRHRRSRRSRSSMAGELLKVLQILKDDSSKTSSSINNNQLHNVIPEFDPSLRTQSIECWIRKVNECAVIYKWDDAQIIHFALQKLVGYAKTWFEALPTVVFTWSEWQEKLMKAFPSEENYGKLLEEMLARVSRNDENLREYYYDKLTLLNRCQIIGKRAVDCIIHGIHDKSLRNSAQALKCQEPEDMLNFLNAQSYVELNTSGMQKRRDRIFRNRFSNASFNSTSNSAESGLDCYNCRAKGHTFTKCPKPLLKCTKCHRIGHDSDHCRAIRPLGNQGIRTENRDGDKTKTTLKVSTNNPNDKYYKPITINGKSSVAYIDFGSECTLMRDTDAQKFNLTKCPGSLPIVKGFGNSNISPLYKTFACVKVDEVETSLEILVVNDDLLQTSVLIGQNFTELPAVTVLKDSDTLLFYSNPTFSIAENPNERIDLITSECVNVVQTQLLPVFTSEKTFTGDVYVEGYYCHEPGREYHLHRGAYRIKDGQGHIVVTTMSRKPVELCGQTVIARALKFVEKQVLHVNRIHTDNSNVEPLKKEEIHVGCNIDEKSLDKLYELLQSYRDCFATNLSEIGCTNQVEMQIDLTDDKPVVYRPYRLSFSEREQVKQIVDELLENDIIQESCSNYASPILMVKKKTGEQRLCVDFRALNNKTVKDKFPLPLIDDQLTNLSGNKFFTTLDLASGYYQVPLAEKSRHLTGFVTPDGHYEFKRMPFGLANAPAVFQRMMNVMLGHRRFHSVLAYLDDLLIPSKTIEEGYNNLEEILKLLREFGLTLKLSKCHFFNESLTYLGYEVSEEGIKPSQEKILAVKEFPVPSNIHEVRQFLGLSSYFRKFVKGFADRMRPWINFKALEIENSSSSESSGAASADDNDNP
ncbi:uncharacterized protein LOC125488660 [Plutella xylostella]|uniref:uncharacterized protein LOC125488660 n=1 Tax=Plutella xylostella TaxID=51655 RepID=UPI0020323691|nr:uncharacterized protein LOC125488660 [Plutella xylostella]